jgi:o-succinylbenzoate synthase
VPTSFTLRRLILREIHLELREPFTISSGSVRDRRILIVEAQDQDGASGFAECVAGELPYYSAETVETAWLAIELWIGPRLLGRPLAAAAEAHDILAAGIRGHPMAKAAVEMALWALEAQRRGVALARLLGGTREQVPAGISLGLQPTTPELVARACAAVQEGYQRVKLKVKPGADLELVAAVRTALGARAALSVDANCAYRLEDAEHLRRFDDHGLVMIEQPLRAGDLVRHAELQRGLRTPLCLDESIVDVEDVRDLIRLDAGRIVNVKPGRVGGFTSALRIHDACAAAGIPNWCGGMLESGIGRAHNVALASLPNFTLPGDISPSARYWQKDVVAPEWTMDRHGFVRVPLDRPGLGVLVDLPRIDELCVRRQALAAR